MKTVATVVQYSALRTCSLLLVLAGCGASMVIPRGDSTYRRAIAHYRRTRQLVAASLAPDEDQAMFLQAEALFRYRFESGAPSTGAVFAELAASATDLPMLESVAGSLDLLALRLQANDGAIQLWETLLDRFPETPLRALALYRLGWAYRNVMAEGFPGSSRLRRLTAAGTPVGVELAQEARRWMHPCTGSGRTPSGDHRCEQGNSQPCTHDTIVPDRVECRHNIGAILSSRRRRVQRLVSPRRGPRAAFAWRIHGFR